MKSLINTQLNKELNRDNRKPYKVHKLSAKKNKNNVKIGILILVLFLSKIIIPITCVHAYTGFSIRETVEIELEGDSNNNTKEITYTVAKLIQLYETTSAEYQIIDTRYKTYEKQQDVYRDLDNSYTSQLNTYTDNIDLIEDQIEDYEKKIIQAGTDGNHALIDQYVLLQAQAESQREYYQSLYEQTILSKADNTHQMELNTFNIDNRVPLMNHDKEETKQAFIDTIVRLISLEYEEKYFKKQRTYYGNRSNIQKIKLNHDEIMKSEYDVTEAEEDVTEAKLRELSNEKKIINAYIRSHTGLSQQGDISIEFDIESVLDVNNERFEDLIEARYHSDLQVESLAHQITCKEHLIQNLIHLYPEETHQNELMHLEIEQLRNQLEVLVTKQEQEKEAFILNYNSLRKHYNVLENKADALYQLAYEKDKLYESGLITRIDLLNVEIDKQKVQWDIYSVIERMIQLADVY